MRQNGWEIVQKWTANGDKKLNGKEEGNGLMGRKSAIPNLIQKLPIKAGKMIGDIKRNME